MARKVKDIQNLLAQENKELKHLSRRHRELDERLMCLNGKFLLSAEEKMEEVVIKKKKLAIKDRMALMHRSD